MKLYYIGQKCRFIMHTDDKINFVNGQELEIEERYSDFYLSTKLFITENQKNDIEEQLQNLKSK